MKRCLPDKQEIFSVWNVKSGIIVLACIRINKFIVSAELINFTCHFSHFINKFPFPEQLKTVTIIYRKNHSAAECLYGGDFAKIIVTKPEALP